jgi:uncharacterized protein (DUF2235 family)
MESSFSEAAKQTLPSTPGRRLILLLDGTWNNRDDNTNIFHLNNLVADMGTDGKRQVKRYFKGVGTGVLDHVSGGVFGFGLDENIRAAYEWLIEHYEEGDEIFVFGFSRGAFTARSLCGLLSNCGLLRPGAPLTTTQLFQGYGRMRPKRGLIGWVKKLLGSRQMAFRPLYNLLRLKYAAKDKESQGMLGEEKKFYDSLSHAERWLLRWTRSVHIQCVGVFDTVGSMGLDALGIHWLHTQKWAFHNTNPNRVIKHGFQALAIDENRANFSHISWNKFIPKEPEDQRKLEQHSRTFGEPDIHQRWFVGAHSNIGGGYATNPLCLFPLAWMMDCASGLGLGFQRTIQRPAIAECQPLKTGSERSLRDSYAEFLRPGFLSWMPFGIWAVITLGCRHLREVAPPARDIVTHDGKPGTLESYNETLDESVKDFWNANPNYRPGNLQKYFARSKP